MAFWKGTQFTERPLAVVKLRYSVTSVFAVAQSNTSEPEMGTQECTPTRTEGVFLSNKALVYIYDHLRYIAYCISSTRGSSLRLQRM